MKYQKEYNNIHLILGGAKSGKTKFAESMINKFKMGTYIATASADDKEMAIRIKYHKQQRSKYCHTLEEPIELSAAIRKCYRLKKEPILIDCLTLWISNLLLKNFDLKDYMNEFLQLLPTLNIPIFIVSNEISLGVVPENTLARNFRDNIGQFHQDIAEIADQVTILVAGIPLHIKSKST